MAVSLRSLLLVALGVALAGCQLVYKLPTRQGNVIEQKKLDQLELGMTREQVRFLLGTPLAANPFDDRRWDYLGYYRSPRGAVSERTVSLFFEGDRLVAMQGQEPRNRETAEQEPSPESVIEREERERLEAERQASEDQQGLGRPDRSP